MIEVSRLPVTTLILIIGSFSSLTRIRHRIGLSPRHSALLAFLFAQGVLKAISSFTPFFESSQSWPGVSLRSEISKFIFISESSSSFPYASKSPHQYQWSCYA